MAPDFLRGDMFNGIALAALPGLLACIQATEKDYAQDAFIIEEDSEVTQFGVLVSGQARSIKWDASDRVVMLALLSPGDVMGVMLAARPGSRSPVAVQATQPSRVLHIAFDKLVARCPLGCPGHEQLLRNYIVVTAQKGLELYGRINCLLKPTVREKVLTYLRGLGCRPGSTITLPLSRHVMAEYLNVERSALSRELSRMQRDGLISYQRNVFRLMR